MQSSDMKSMGKYFVLAVSFLVGGMTTSFAVTLQGAASVNVTSDTAATAKNMAFDEARRQILNDKLRQYADADAVKDAIKNAKSSELANLILSSSIDGEQVSDTTYSASVSMTVDIDAARNWLVQNEIQNWLPTNDVTDTFVVNVQMPDKLVDWSDLNRIARAKNIDLNVVELAGNTVRLNLPKSVRTDFTIAIRGAGWRYADKNGELNIWK
jgi:hypothetical protein